MKRIKDNEYLEIISPIINNEKYNGIEKIKHHDSNRLEHCKKVSYYSYKIAKILGLDEEATARAGLLHDFYYESIADENRIRDKIKLYSFKHQEEALYNSKENFFISKKEENIIISHMFPLTKKIPRYRESWVVTTVDKSVSIWEFTKKINYRISIFILFFVDILSKKY